MLIIVSLYLLYNCIFYGVLSKNSIWCLKIYVGSEEVVNRWIQPREGEQSDVIICQDCLLCHAANYSSYLLQFYRKLNSYIYFYIYFSVQCMTARFFRC